MSLGRQMARVVRWIERRLLVELSVAGFAACVGLDLLGAGHWAGLAASLALAVMLIRRLSQLLGRLGPARVEATGKNLEFVQGEMLLLSMVYLMILLSGGEQWPI